MGHLSCGIELQTKFAYCWGPNEFGQIGDSTTNDRLLPTLVDGGIRFSSISARGNTTTCGTEDGTSLAYCWGLNNRGQVGDGTTTNRLSPTLVGNGFPRFRSISTAYSGACGVEAESATGYCWGNGQTAPTPVPPLSSAPPARSTVARARP